jgi:hypothetical protein
VHRPPGLGRTCRGIESRSTAGKAGETAVEFGRTTEVHIVRGLHQTFQNLIGTVLEAYRASPWAMSELSCGQTDPL